MAQFLTFSNARPEDLEEILEVHACAYPDARTYAERRLGLTDSLLGGLADMVLARRGHKLVGFARLFELQVHAWRETWKVGGIASVAVAPEHRGEGVASELLGHLHERSRTRGHLGTLLYAFRDAFYVRAGYVQLAPFLTLDFAPLALPVATHGARRVLAAELPTLSRLYAACAQQGMGCLVRSEEQWQRRLLNERRHAFLLGDEGYLSFRYEQHEAHAQTTLAVESWGAATPAGRKRLQGFLAAQRDQVARVVLPCAVNDPFPLSFVDADRHRYGTAALEHPYGTLAAGPMFRPHAIEALLAARPPKRSVIIALPDKTLRASDSEIVLGAPSARVDLRFANEGDLARVLLGGASLAELGTLGLAQIDAQNAENLWPSESRYFSFDAF
jgi:predicted N-acetyltransferase YhbS